MRIRKIAKSDYFFRHLSVCPSVPASVRMKYLGFHWTDFHEI